MCPTIADSTDNNLFPAHGVLLAKTLPTTTLEHIVLNCTVYLPGYDNAIDSVVNSIKSDGFSAIIQALPTCKLKSIGAHGISSHQLSIANSLGNGIVGDTIDLLIQNLPRSSLTDLDLNRTYQGIVKSHHATDIPSENYFTEEHLKRLLPVLEYTHLTRLRCIHCIDPLAFELTQYSILLQRSEPRTTQCQTREEKSARLKHTQGALGPTG